MIKRLYNFFKPNSYDLHLNIDSENAEFSGRIGINGIVSEAASEILLHSKDLVVTAASINGAEVEFSESEFDTLHLLSSRHLETGEATVVVEFRGKITDAMHGMYPCYFEHEGKKKKLIATQFESHHAREVFPCIDEPAAKATFDLELVTQAGETVLANTPIKNQKEESSRLITEFETTPRMSTYLLAFVAGEMVMKESKTKDGVVVRSWASAAQKADWLEYSLAETVKLIEFYNEYFDVPYPLSKCDQVALPDFESGAMENWGLITYRETVFLADPLNSSLGTKQYISLVIAHELSHQWFGNLVTMQWWDDLWLNESFANMTEYLAVDALHPEWHMWEEFASQDAISATNRDVFSNVQSVQVAVHNPEEIHTLFDPSIVYAKGGKLLKTLRDLLGDTAWRAGLKDYFEAHAYQNTTREDLWTALSRHTALDISKLMNAWIERPGQPLVTLKQTSKTVELSQERLLLDAAETDSTHWEIPLLSPALPAVLSQTEEVITLETDDWVKLNLTGAGHYIVNYTNPEHKHWLAQQLGSKTTESTWKIARFNELIMLAKHVDTHLDEALEAISQCADEERASVWTQICTILGQARQLTEGNAEVEKIIKQFGYSLAKANFRKLGWEYQSDEDSNITHLRTTMIGLAVGSEDKSVIKTALTLFRSKKDPEELPAEIRSILMGVAVRFGTDDEFALLLEKYKQSSNADYKNDIVAALLSTKDKAKAQQLATLMKDTSVVRTQDTLRWYIYMLRNYYIRDVAWGWITQNWNWIESTFGDSKSFDDFARYSASFFNTKQGLKDYQALFEPYKDSPSLARSIKVGVEEIKARTAWRERDEAAVTQWLTQHAAKTR